MKGQHWPQVPLIHAMSTIMDFRGRTPRKLGMAWGNGTIPALSARNVRMGLIDFSLECNLGSEVLYQRWMVHGDVKLGDIVFTTEAPLGNVALIPDHRRYILSQRTVLLRPDTEFFCPGFVAQYMQSDHFQRRLFKSASGSTALGIQRKRLEKLNLPCPPLLEQQRIAAALSDADELIVVLERLIAKKQAIKQGMMQQLLTGQTRLPGFTEEWARIPLGDHVRYLRTVALSRAQLDRESPIKCLHYGDIHTAHGVYLAAATASMPCADVELAASAGRLDVGDVVFADASEDPGGVGKSLEITSVPAAGVVAGLHTIAARFDSAVLADGFKAHLQFIPAFRRALLRLAAGTKVLATTRPYISSVTLELPPCDEQDAIAEVLFDADAEIDLLARRLAKARAVKQGMMQELLTGRTRLGVAAGAE